LGGCETGWTGTNDEQIGIQLSRRPYLGIASHNAGRCKSRHARHLCSWPGIFQACAALSAVDHDRTFAAHAHPAEDASAFPTAGSSQRPNIGVEERSSERLARKGVDLASIEAKAKAWA